MHVHDEYAEPATRDILARYETIRDYARTMRHYAAAGDWQQLITLQTTYVGAMEAVADAERGIELPAADASHKYTLVLEIRAAEVDIRACLNRRMAELSQSMAASRQRGNAVRAYQSEGHA